MKIKFFLFLLIVLSGCAHMKAVQPQFAILITNDVTIEAVDGSWVMEPNKVFLPPKVKPNAFTVAVSKINNNSFESHFYAPHLTDVIVKTSNGAKLYGKIVFNQVFTSTKSSSAKRKWTVGIPESYINQAKSGSIAVIYQPYLYISPGRNEDLPSWILWISSEPF